MRNSAGHYATKLSTKTPSVVPSVYLADHFKKNSVVGPADIIKMSKHPRPKQPRPRRRLLLLVLGKENSSIL